MKKFFVLLFLITAVRSEAQNLVSNPGFEDMLNCPQQIGLSNYMSSWETWRGTPDYFHPCANSTHPNFGVPYNNRGYQNPHSGLAYIGLFTFSNFKVNEREFVGIQLLQPLVIGLKYYVSFWISNPDTNYLAHSTDNIGVKFSTVQHSLVQPDTVTNIAHVFSTSVVYDTSSWVQVSGSFIADSAYTFIELGNFFQDSLSSIIDPINGISRYAYYFFDDICVSTDSGICNLKTGIREDAFTSGNIDLYPNPAKDKLHIKFSDYSAITVRIYNVIGEIYYEEKLIDTDQLHINLKKYSGGLYFLELSNNVKRILKRFVVTE